MSEDPKVKDRDEDEVEDEDYDPQAQVIGDWKLLDLPEIPVVTGEEEEETIAKFRSKIYRWNDKQWKERGVGDLKLLKHKKTGLIRALVRADTTHKCIVNHLIQAKQIFCKLEAMKTSNNAWTWAAYQISDEKPVSEKLCAKFTSKDDFQNFKIEFEKAAEENGKILAEAKSQEEKTEKVNAEQRKE